MRFLILLSSCRCILRALLTSSEGESVVCLPACSFSLKSNEAGYLHDVPVSPSHPRGHFSISLRPERGHRVLSESCVPTLLLSVIRGVCYLLLVDPCDGGLPHFPFLVRRCYTAPHNRKVSFIICRCMRVSLSSRAVKAFRKVVWHYTHTGACVVCCWCR